MVKSWNSRKTRTSRIDLSGSICWYDDVDICWWYAKCGSYIYIFVWVWSLSISLRKSNRPHRLQKAPRSSKPEPTGETLPAKKSAASHHMMISSALSWTLCTNALTSWDHSPCIYSCSPGVLAVTVNQNVVCNCNYVKQPKGRKQMCFSLYTVHVPIFLDVWEVPHRSWTASCISGRLADFGWLACSLIDWLLDWLFDCSIDWLSDS